MAKGGLVALPMSYAFSHCFTATSGAEACIMTGTVRYDRDAFWPFYQLSTNIQPP